MRRGECTKNHTRLTSPLPPHTPSRLSVTPSLSLPSSLSPFPPLTPSVPPSLRSFMRENDRGKCKKGKEKDDRSLTPRLRPLRTSVGRRWSRGGALDRSGARDAGRSLGSSLGLWSFLPSSSSYRRPFPLVGS